MGQIYLLANPLLREPLSIEHVKPRLIGHFGTTPGLNFIYVHLNRAITERDLEVLYVTGPGHGAPGVLANIWLEGTYSEVYPEVSQDEEGMPRFFRQFSFPGGIPSHTAPETPGSIHEGGELGYSLAHAFGAAFDNPELVVTCVVGDGEAETGPLATSWHSNKFLNPARDGAVLPILQLNRWKIANPTLLARMSDEELTHLFRGYGYAPRFVEGDDPQALHPIMTATLDTIVDDVLEAVVERGAETGAVAAGLRGEVAIASARCAYGIFAEIMASDRFRRLAERGARPQRLLWASTGTKNPKYQRHQVRRAPGGTPDREHHAARYARPRTTSTAVPRIGYARIPREPPGSWRPWPRWVSTSTR